ncbi:unnamed protein product [Bemisia tabaci]|uniref:C2H2-type domain-containing protein n=1 Tax=Bemisia tabaci TaxID=7038 RepID=A0A9P0A1C0_BEMTA|nr:unnamed protein product [Bemisia tabaci]
MISPLNGDLARLFQNPSTFLGFKRGFQPFFQCPKCPKSYTHFSSLQKHIKWGCGKEPQFQCKSCSKRFYLLGQLNWHSKLKHPGQS